MTFASANVADCPAGEAAPSPSLDGVALPRLRTSLAAGGFQTEAGAWCVGSPVAPFSDERLPPAGGCDRAPYPRRFPLHRGGQAAPETVAGAATDISRAWAWQQWIRRQT